MTKQNFLNFAEISKDISFHDLLDWLNIPYQKNGKELKGKDFIVSVEKNLYFSTVKDNNKGSVINFLANHKDIDLREAASILKIQFLSKEKTPSPIIKPTSLHIWIWKWIKDHCDKYSQDLNVSSGKSIVVGDQKICLTCLPNYKIFHAIFLEHATTARKWQSMN